MFSQDLTIINKWYDKSQKKDIYYTHQLKGFWSSSNGIMISNTALTKTDGFIARILMSEVGYQTPKEFSKNPIGWTLNNDDYIVKGIVNKVDKIADLKSNYECMKITNISVKDYSSDSMKHFAISGA